MLRIRVEDTKVIIVVTTTDGWDFNFTYETGHEAWALLLASSLRRKRNDEDVADWRRAYNQGWADAKAKRAKATA